MRSAATASFSALKCSLPPGHSATRSSAGSRSMIVNLRARSSGSSCVRMGTITSKSVVSSRLPAAAIPAWSASASDPVSGRASRPARAARARHSREYPSNASSASRSVMVSSTFSRSSSVFARVAASLVSATSRSTSFISARNWSDASTAASALPPGSKSEASLSASAPRRRVVISGNASAQYRPSVTNTCRASARRRFTAEATTLPSWSAAASCSSSCNCSRKPIPVGFVHHGAWSSVNSTQRSTA